MGYRELIDRIKINREERSTLADMLLEAVPLTRAEILHYKVQSFSLNAEQERILESFLQQLNQGIPLQYIVGYAYFFDLKLMVNQQVLIPRPETEELVTSIQTAYAKDNHLNILDIGTGSGCIALALKKAFTHARVFGLDISAEALAVAKQNALSHQLAVEFIQADILDPDTFPFDIKWDIIVSNPPYIPVHRKSEMAKQVVDHEPHLALFVEDHDPFLFYKKILDFAYKHLQDDGQVFFEISQYEYLQEYPNWHIEMIPDMSGNARMIKAKKVLP